MEVISRFEGLLTAGVIRTVENNHETGTLTGPTVGESNYQVADIVIRLRAIKPAQGDVLHLQI